MTQSGVPFQDIVDIQTCTRPENTLYRPDGSPWTSGEQTFGEKSPKTWYYIPYSESEYRTPRPPGSTRWFRRHKTGDIIFTNYVRTREQHWSRLVQVPHRFREWKWRRLADSAAGTCYAQWFWSDDWSYVEQFSYQRAQSLFVDKMPLRGVQVPDVQNVTRAVEQRAYRDATSQVDLLTELAEAEKTVDFCGGLVGRAAQIFDSNKPPKRLNWVKGVPGRQLIRNADKAVRKWGRRWLALQYALLPIVYLLEDTHKLATKAKKVYKTARDDRVISLSTNRPPNMEGNQCYAIQEGDMKVRSTCKVSYRDGAIQRLMDQVQFNVFATAWELLPWSFVVDWFYGVGDAIYTKTSVDLSTDVAGCTSHKVDASRTVYLWWDAPDHSEFWAVDHPCSPGGQLFSFDYTRTVDEPLHSHRVQTYNRFTWRRPSAKPAFDPYLSWKRYLSAAALAYEPTRRLLKGLR